MLVVIAALDLSLHAGVVAVMLLAAAYAVHHRFAAVWGIGCVLLAIAFLQAMRDAITGPRTPLAIMCSVLAMLCTALIGSWWWRQRSHFFARRRDET